MGLQPELCPKFHAAVELVGRRWTGAVVRLLLHGRMRYAELRTAIPDISDRMLSERLRELESEGIVARRVVPETPVRVEYELTEKGRSLERALGEIAKWAERWGSHDAADAPPAAAGAREPRTRRSRTPPSARSSRRQPRA